MYGIIVANAIVEIFSDKPVVHPDIEVVDLSAYPSAQVDWVRSAQGSNDWHAPVAPTPALPQLISALLSAASAACDAVTKQVTSTDTRLPAYVNAAGWVRAAGGAPTADPYMTSFNNWATSMGTTSALLATLIETLDVAPVNLVTALNALGAAAETAPNAAALATALASFESALNNEVAAINAALKTAGVAIVLNDPASITIPGINA